MCFSPYLGVGVGGGGWLPRGLGQNLLMQFSRLRNSKMEISETNFFYTLTIQNDQISYVNHVLAPFMCFSPYLGVGVWGPPTGASSSPHSNLAALPSQPWKALQAPRIVHKPGIVCCKATPKVASPHPQATSGPHM